MKRRFLPIAIPLCFAFLFLFSCKPPLGGTPTGPDAGTPPAQTPGSSGPVSQSERILLDFENRIRIANGLSPRALGADQVAALIAQLRQRLQDANLYGDFNPVDVTMKVSQSIGPALAAAGIPASEAESVAVQTVEAALLIVSKPEFADEVLAAGGSADALASQLKAAVASSMQAAAAAIGLSADQANAIAAEILGIDLAETVVVSGVTITTDSLGRTLKETYAGKSGGTASLVYDYSVPGQITVTGGIDSASVIAPKAVARIKYDSENRATELRLTIGNPAASFIPFKVGTGFIFSFEYPAANSLRMTISAFCGPLVTYALPGYYCLNGIVTDERGRLSSAAFGAQNEDGSAKEGFPSVAVNVGYGAPVTGRRYGVSKLMKLVLGPLFDDSVQEAAIAGTMAKDGETTSLVTSFAANGDVSIAGSTSANSDACRYDISLRTLKIEANSSSATIPSENYIQSIALQLDPAVSGGADSRFDLAMNTSSQNYRYAYILDGDLRMKTFAGYRNGETAPSWQYSYSYDAAYDGRTWDILRTVTGMNDQLEGSILDPGTGRSIEEFTAGDTGDQHNESHTLKTYDSRGRIATSEKTSIWESKVGGTPQYGSKTVEVMDAYDYENTYTRRQGTVTRYSRSTSTSDWILDQTSTGTFDEWSSILLNGTESYASGNGYVDYYTSPPAITSANVSSVMSADRPWLVGTKTTVFKDSGNATVATSLTRWGEAVIGDTTIYGETGKDISYATSRNTSSFGGPNAAYDRAVLTYTWVPENPENTMFSTKTLAQFYSGSTLTATRSDEGVWSQP